MPRPRSVTLLAVAVLSLAAFNLLGAVSGWERYAFLRRLPLSVPLAYLIGSNAVWAVVFAALAVGLWRLKRWGRIGTLTLFPLYLVQGWFDRLVFGRSDYSQVPIVWAALLNGLWLGLVWVILWRPKVRQRFGRDQWA